MADFRNIAGGLMGGFNKTFFPMMQAGFDRKDREKDRKIRDEMFEWQKQQAEQDRKYKEEQNLKAVMGDMRSRIGMAEMLTGPSMMNMPGMAQQLSNVPVAQQAAIYKTMNPPPTQQLAAKKLQDYQPAQTQEQKDAASLALFQKKETWKQLQGLNDDQKKAVATYISLKKQAISIKAGVGIAGDVLQPGRGEAVEEADALAERVKEHAIKVLKVDPGLFGESKKADMVIEAMTEEYPPAKHKDVIIRDKQTGKEYKSNGTEWVWIQRKPGLK